MKIGLVACCDTKLNYPAPAREIYQGQMFKKAARFCQENYDMWFILSAEHKLLHPDTVIRPYNKKLPYSPKKLDSWAKEVLKQLEPYIIKDNVFYLHAGIRYRTICKHLPVYEVPMKGLFYGQQLAWYNKRFRGEKQCQNTF